MRAPRRTLAAAVAMALAAAVVPSGCTLKRVPIPGVGGPDGGSGGGSGAGGGAGAGGGSGAGGGDGGAGSCHALATTCSASLASIPLEALWAGYWEADVGVETAPATGGAGAYPGVMRWTSRVGSASLLFPADAAATFPDETPVLTPPRYELGGWCSGSPCLPAVRFERPAGTAVTNEGQLLLSEDADVTSVVASGARTLSLVMEIEVEPDADLRTETFASFGPASGNYPYFRAYLSGTTFRAQSQLSSGGALDRVDFDASVARSAHLFVAYVIDLDATDQATFYVANGNATPTVAGVTSANAIELPIGAARLTLGALGRGRVGDLLDGRVRRFAISSTALDASQVAEIASAWQTADAALIENAATAYLQAVALSDPLLFARLGAATAGPKLPFGAQIVSPAQAQIGDCATTFTGGYVEIPDDAAYSIPTSGSGMTVEVWVRFDDPNPLGEPGSTGNKDYIHYLGKGDTNQMEWAFRAYDESSIDRPGRLSFYAWSLDGGIGPGQYFDPTCERDVGRWVHVVGVADDPGVPNPGLHIFVDGEPGAGAANLYDGASPPADGTAPLRLGTRTPPGVGENGGLLLGALADFAIYPRALGQGEIEAHYAAASGLRY